MNTQITRYPMKLPEGILWALKQRPSSQSSPLSLIMVFSVNAAPKSSAPFVKVLQDAEMIASLNPEWGVQRTAGDSIGDFYGDNSLILVQTASIKHTRVGMMVADRSPEGEHIERSKQPSARFERSPSPHCSLQSAKQFNKTPPQGSYSFFSSVRSK
jgi:hypothetical protein